MSILDDAKELGYGPNHFMITGEDYPWEEEQEYEVDESAQHLEYLTDMNETLDSKEGWLKKGFYLAVGEKPIGTIEGIEYYHIDRVTPLSKIRDSTHSSIKDAIDNFLTYISANDIKNESDINAQFDKLKNEVLSDVENIYEVLKHQHNISKYIAPEL